MTRIVRSRAAILGLLVVGLGGAPLVHAQAEPQRRLSFRIEPADSAAALTEFGRQSGQQVLFARREVSGVRLNPVHGNFAPAEALRLMLDGTGLQAKTDGSVVVITVATTAPGADASTRSLEVGGEYPQVASTVPSAVGGVVAIAADSEGGSVVRQVSQAELGEIVVTARKRTESLLRTPVTVAALTAEDVEARGIVSLVDVANATPGLNLNNNSVGRADRSFQQLVLRGFTPSTVLATTTSMFIDGVPVASPSALTSISEPARIEVLKGPQSAYFGRNTFAGAVNVVNKVPTGEWGGSVTAMAGTRDNYRVRGSVEGPLFSDVVAFRLAADHFAKDGSYRNAYDGGTLGDQSSTTASLLIAARPTDGLTLKAMGLVVHDHDGVSANSRFMAYDVLNLAGGVVVKGQSNCTLNGSTTGVAGTGTTIARPFFCGTLSKLANPVSSNTLDDALVNTFQNDPTGRLLSPSEGIDGYGMVRDYYHVHVTGDWALTPALTVSALAGLNHEQWSQFSDVDGYDSTSLPNFLQAFLPGSRAYFDFPFLVEREEQDWSLELRAAWEPGTAFHGTFGASLLDAKRQSDIGAGAFIGNASAAAATSGIDRSRTLGAFFGLTYDLTAAFSLSAEGRFQTDSLYAYAPPSGQLVTSSVFVPAKNYGANELVVKEKFTNFLPRVIANYRFNDDLMAYGSAAKGVNPGAFNAGLLGQTDAVQRAAVAAGLGITVDPERVTSFELGLKGRALDGALRFTVAGFYSQWRDQINAINFVAGSGPTGPVLAGGSANTGSVDLYGVEGDVTWRLNDLVTLNFAGAINESSINEFIGPEVSKLSGITDFSGKEQPNTSKYSATAGVQLGHAFKSLTDATWFARADWVFKSGMWSNQANVVKTGNANVFNLRGGITKGRLTVEAFVNNAFDEDAYASISDNWVIEPSFSRFDAFSAVLVGLREKRTAGVQASFKF